MTLLKITTLLVFLFASYFAALEASTLYPNTSHVNVVRCIEKERRALLKFKDDAVDAYGILSSWSGHDCCTWNGVGCRYPTGEVVSLHLPGNYSGDYLIQLGGKISNHLNELQHLRYLNLSNNFFSGMIPPQLGNLSNLHVLDLNYGTTYDTYVSDLNWISSLSSLKFLGLSGINLSLANSHWLQAINSIPSLEELHMVSSDLNIIPQSLSQTNLTSLSVLDLRFNYFNTQAPQWLSNLTSNLVVLKLEGCSFRGPISNFFSHDGDSYYKLEELTLFRNEFSGEFSDSLEHLKSLRTLDLSENSITGPLPTSIGKLSKLEFLVLSYNNFSGELPDSLEHLKSLRVLELGRNSITGSLPTFIGKLSKLEVLELRLNNFSGELPESMEHLKSLRTLDLSDNSISGPLSTFIGKLSKLEFLDLSFNNMNDSIPKSLGKLEELKTLFLYNNKWKGILSQDHFEHLSKLKELYISTLSGGLVFNMSCNWVPSFSLIDIYIEGCDLGPKFPKWLQTQTQLEYIHLRNVSISDTIPSWLWKLHPLSLVLSENSLNGNIPTFLGNMSKLSNLDLSNNQLSGTVHDNWNNSLSVINFSWNNLTGKFPSSLLSSEYLFDLKLNNNNISGELPIALNTSPMYLELLDLGDNKLCGSIPEWIAEVTTLQALRMRGNSFSGSISEQFCRLQSLHVLDLAQNNLSGHIPPCLSQLNGMSLTTNGMSFPISSGMPVGLNMDLNLKGIKYTYGVNLLVLVSVIDLSCNNLSGFVPENITNLTRLGYLNLSNNHLTGTIPLRIGDMQNLETLDLSSNHFYGQIPPSISSMTFLNHLNLSHNHLSGPIPSGGQLSTFNESNFEGNSGLCGSPLPTKCKSLVIQEGRNEHGEDNDIKDGKLGLFVTVALGFLFGFWSIWGTLVAKKSWRRAYFGVIDKIIDRIVVIVGVNLNRIYKIIAKEGSN